MRKSVTFLLLFALWATAVPAQVITLQGEENKQLFVQSEQILSELSEISGLKPKHEIEHALIDKAHVKQFLEQRIEEEVKPEELRAEELTLKKFGLVPQDFNLRKTTVDLLTEQAAAFYDFRKKKLFVLESAPSALQQMALVHELAHALADQYFNLEKFIDSVKQSDDAATARMAVMEGQATWLMSEYLARRTGQSLKTSPAILQMMASAAEMSAGQFPIFDAAPLYMRETLLFPYSKGMLFQHAVIEKEGQAAFASVFRHPPESTQQILHPEKYFEAVKPANPALPALVTEKGYKEITKGSIGELDHFILFRQYAGKKEASEVSPHWRGGSYRLLEGKDSGRTVLAYVSQWENPDMARECFYFYQRVLKGKWNSMKVTEKSENHVAGQGDDGYFLLRVDGSTVTSLEGMEGLREAKVLPGLH